MGYLLHPGEDSLLKELKENGYYVWMNDRNDLTAGQIPGWTEAHADEIYYSGQVQPGPGPENPWLRGEPGSKYYYSHFEGRLKLDETGKHSNSDDEVVEAAIDRILHPVDDKPICLFLGLMYPHTPYQVEEPYYSAIDRSQLLPRIPAADCQDKAKILSEIRKYQHMDQFTEADWNELRAVYLAMCMKIDAQFGRLIQALKNAGIYDDCAIFFLSDHGDFTGDYDLVEKAQNSFEECLTRVPFLVKPPQCEGVDPGISLALTELIDFYATVLDYAGIKASHTHFGRSLRENVTDRKKTGREYVFCEGGRQPGETHCDEYHGNNGSIASEKIVYWPKMKAQSDDEAHAKGIMMRSDRYKYISRTLGNDEFYDLEKDPQERANEINNDVYRDTVLRMQISMLKWLQATGDIVPFKEDQRFTPEMMWARVRSLVPAGKEAEVRAMIDRQISFIQVIQYCRSLNEEK